MRLSGHSGSFANGSLSHAARSDPLSLAVPSGLWIDGSLTPAVATLSRIPRTPAWPMASSSLSGVLSSMTATPRAHPTERGRVIGAVGTGRNDHHPLDARRFVQRRHVFGQHCLGRIRAPRKERELVGIAVDMGMSIACAGRHVEVHRRGPLRTRIMAPTGIAPTNSSRRVGIALLPSSDLHPSAYRLFAERLH